MITQMFKNLFRRKTRTLLTVSGIAVGVAMIVLNYMGILPPGQTVQQWLWAGLGCIGAGFALSTRWN